MNDSSSSRIASAIALALACLTLACGPDAGSRDNKPKDMHGDHDGHDHDGHDHGAAGDSHGDSHGEDLHLSAEAIRDAGIVTKPAGPGRLAETLALTARVTVDENTVVHVNPRVGGIVHAIHKGLGDRVAAGEPIVEIDSVERGRVAGDALKARAELEAARLALANETTLFDERQATLERLLDGAIAVAQGIFDREKELYEKGISLARPFLDAEKELKLAVFERERQLSALHAERATRLLALKATVRTAEIDDEGARDRLRCLGVGDAEIDALGATSHETLGRYSLVAPRDGVIVERHITQGEFVEPTTTLATIQDLERLWILVAVHEKDIGRVRVGQRAEIRLDAFPESPLSGVIGVIDFHVSQETRSVDVRIEVKNERLAGSDATFPLRPGMFGSAAIAVREEDVPLAIPESALVRSGGAEFVFVREADGAFARQVVMTGRRGGGMVEIKEGLEAGAAVVTDGVFTLRSMLEKESMSHGHDH